MVIPAGTFITVTGSGGGAPFTSALVDRQIWKPYDVNGNGGGRAWITNVVDGTHLQATLIDAFDNLNALNAGQWMLTTNQVTNLEYLEGQVVQVVEDGGLANPKTVTNGTITLDQDRSTAFVGLGYTGILETLNIDVGGERGSAEAKPRNLIKSMTRFLNTIGAQFGTSYYRLEKWLFRSGKDFYGRPTAPYSGIKEQAYNDNTSSQFGDNSKQVVIIQQNPLPCNVSAIDVFIETADE